MIWTQVSTLESRSVFWISDKTRSLLMEALLYKGLKLFLPLVAYNSVLLLQELNLSFSPGISPSPPTPLPPGERGEFN